MTRKLSLLILPLVIAITTLFCSCDKGGYSLDKFSVSLATVRVIQGNSYFLELDNGKTLWPAAQNFQYKPTHNERVMANYTLLSDSQSGYDHFVKVNGLSRVLTKGPLDLTENNKDSIGNDPVVIEDIWYSGRYLNIIFGYNSSNGYTHYINLVNNLTVNQPEDGKIHLEFRHNANRAPASYGTRGVVSFDLQSTLQGEERSTLSIKVKEFKGEKQIDIPLTKSLSEHSPTPFNSNGTLE